MDKAKICFLFGFESGLQILALEKKMGNPSQGLTSLFMGAKPSASELSEVFCVLADRPPTASSPRRLVLFFSQASGSRPYQTIPFGDFVSYSELLSSGVETNDAFQQCKKDKYHG